MIQGEPSEILSTFIKLPFVFKIFVLSILVWMFFAGLLYMYKYIHHKVLSTTYHLRIQISLTFWHETIVSLIKWFCIGPVTGHQSTILPLSIFWLRANIADWGPVTGPIQVLNQLYWPSAQKKAEDQYSRRRTWNWANKNHLINDIFIN